MHPETLPVEAIQILEWIEDPRRKQAQRHSLVSIMAVVFCGLAMGEEGWDKMADMAKMCWEWFRSTIPCAEEAPSADTLRRVVSGIKPKAFQEYFRQWCKALNLDQSDLLHADGKKIRGSDEGYVVTLFSESGCLSIAQESVGKDGEKVALSNLIHNLELGGTTITMDAGFCSREIAQQLLSAGASYIMALKGNQPELFREVEALVAQQLNQRIHNQSPSIKLDEDHGRCETRVAYVLNDLTLVDLSKPFPGIRTVGWIDSEVHRSNHEIRQGHPPSFSRRYYIASEELSPLELQSAVRSHWSIENKLHWVMDVVFKEDQCQVRHKAAAENLAWMRKLLLPALKRLLPKASLPKALQTMRYSAHARFSLLRLLGGVS